MSSIRNHYETLGVAPGATAEEIRAAYLQLAKDNHPDGQGFKKRDIRDINDAYSVLKDVDRRRLYDAQLALLPNATRPRCAKCKGTGKISHQRSFTDRKLTVCQNCKGTGFQND